MLSVNPASSGSSASSATDNSNIAAFVSQNTIGILSVPGSPTSVVAVSGNASLAVAWVAPKSTGSSVITDYLVKYSSNGGSTWTTFTDPVSTATSVNVTGLTNGTAYVIRVYARNADGSSLPSANSAPATPATVPGSPTSVVAVSLNTSLAVAWTAPTSTGGSAITDYLVKYSSNNGVAGSWILFRDPVSTATSVIVTGLTNGTAYVIKVIARNAVDISLPSANSAPVTAGTVPGRPTSVVAFHSNTSLAVTWIAPDSTGGSPITNYLVQYSSTGGVAGTWTQYSTGSPITATSCTVTGLTNGTAYVIKVIARNSVGISLPSANSAPVGFGCREPFYLQRDTCSLTVIAIPPVFIHIPMKAPSGPTPIDMRRGCTSEKGADPPPRRYGEWAGAERSRAVAARDASADDWRLATARPARAPCRAATPCCRCCREARFPLIRWISSHSWAAFMSSRLGTVRSSCARRVSDIAERYSPSQAFASRASGVSSSRIFWSTESSRYSSSYDDIAATCSLNRTLIRRTSVGV